VATTWGSISRSPETDAARKTFYKRDGQDDPEAVRGLRRSDARLWAGWRRMAGVWGAVANGWDGGE